MYSGFHSESEAKRRSSPRPAGCHRLSRSLRLPLPRPALRPYQTASTGSVSPRRPRHRHFHDRQDTLKVRTHSRCGKMVLKYSRAGSKGPHKQSEVHDDRGPTTLGSRWSPAICLALGSETPPTVASPIAAAPDRHVTNLPRVGGWENDNGPCRLFPDSEIAELIRGSPFPLFSSYSHSRLLHRQSGFSS